MTPQALLVLTIIAELLKLINSIIEAQPLEQRKARAEALWAAEQKRLDFFQGIFDKQLQQGATPAAPEAKKP